MTPSPAPVSRETSPTLTLREVTVTYPDGVAADGTPRTITALDGATLDAHPGTVTAIVGPSGSGKSTLLTTVAGLVVPTRGEVVVDGVRVDVLDDDARAAWRREHVGIVFQQPNLIASLTALEQLQLTAHLAGRRPATATERARALLGRVGLADQAGRRPHQLSGGQRQRVNIARALMARPAVLLADEPTSALDRERSRDVIALLADVTREQGLATLLVTHDPELAQAADRAVHVEDGRLS